MGMKQRICFTCVAVLGLTIFICGFISIPLMDKMMEKKIVEVGGTWVLESVLVLGIGPKIQNRLSERFLIRLSI